MFDYGDYVTEPTTDMGHFNGFDDTDYGYENSNNHPGGSIPEYRRHV